MYMGGGGRGIGLTTVDNFSWYCKKKKENKRRCWKREYIDDRDGLIILRSYDLNVMILSLRLTNPENILTILIFLIYIYLYPSEYIETKDAKKKRRRYD